VIDAGLSQMVFTSWLDCRHLLLALASLTMALTLSILLGFSPEHWVDVSERKTGTPLWGLSMALA
jgi:hypothetical protein